MAKPAASSKLNVKEPSLVAYQNSHSDMPTSTVKHIQRAAANDAALPFLYEATNHEIRFRDERDPKPRSRQSSTFTNPKPSKEWLEEGRSFTR